MRPYTTLVHIQAVLYCHRAALNFTPDTKLADRTSSLSIPTAPPSQPPPTATARKASTHSAHPQSPADTERLRLDLAEAQRSKGELQSRLQVVAAELEKLRTQAKSAGRRIGELVQERGTLMAKLRDRDEELRGKTKLLEVGSCESEAGKHAGMDKH